MERNCERHTFEVADGVCRSCLGSFCTDCLLYAFGPNHEPYCKSCAIAAGGIRSTAGNPRRNIATPAKANGRSGGLLSRLRRGHGPDEDGDELTHEALIELEAAEARELLDEQRLPSESDEEPEPEPAPAPNIAPPGGLDEERELNHRTMPDQIAGGLDLSNAADPEVDSGARLPEPEDARTADGVALFAPVPPEQEEEPLESLATVPTAVGGGADADETVSSKDAHELLRRIADLRGN